MELVERELLDAVARDHDDLEARSVLADYWLERGDADRGAFLQLLCAERPADELAAGAPGWREPLVLSGFPEAELVLDRGVLRHPPVLAAGEALDEQPALFRISPRYYRARRRVREAFDFTVFAADVVTPMRATFTPRHRVALKCLSHPEEPYFAGWLEREHAILSRIRHPNVVETLGYAITRRGRALVTRWAGVGLDGLLRLTRRHHIELGAAFAVSVAIQLCDALEAIHAAGVVHGDIRPEHVLLAEDGTVTVIDLGYARAREARPDEARYYSPGPRERMEFAYMSIEQVRGELLDGRSDLFSMASVISELVENRHPIRDRLSQFEVLIAIRDGRHVLPPLPGALAAVLRATLVPRDQRIATARALRDALVEAAASARLELGPHVIAQTLLAYGVAT